MPTVSLIHTAKGRRLPMRPHEQVEVETARGIVGDRYHGARHRQVTIQSQTALDEAGDVFGALVPAPLTRRNITVSSGVVPQAPGSIVRVGQVVLEVVRVAAPCKLLDDTIGAGAQAALRRRGGSVCRVLSGGVLRVGDPVALDGVDEAETLFG